MGAGKGLPVDSNVTIGDEICVTDNPEGSDTGENSSTVPTT